MGDNNNPLGLPICAKVIPGSEARYRKVQEFITFFDKAFGEDQDRRIGTSHGMTWSHQVAAILLD